MAENLSSDVSRPSGIVGIRSMLGKLTINTMFEIHHIYKFKLCLKELSSHSIFCTALS